MNERLTAGLERGGNMTARSMFGIRPGWVSDELFPFKSHFFDSPRGRMHYIDEGKGEPIVFVHGNPSWSFEFRGPIRGLSGQFRCVAADHIGFGLSERSPRPQDYCPRVHSDNFAALLDHLQLENITLYLTDWGGPIGLDFARRYPDRVRRLILANTWCWPVNTDRHFVMFSRMMSSPVGRFLNRRLNFFVTQVMPRAVGDRKVLGREVMRHYRQAQPDPESRGACAAFPGHIIGASDWLESIWSDRDSFVNKPSLVLWGHKDIAFRQQELNTWQAELTNYECYTFEQSGHFLAEEIPDSVTPLLAEFMHGKSTYYAGCGRKNG